MGQKLQPYCRSKYPRPDRSGLMLTFLSGFFQILQQVNLLKWLPMKPYKFKVFLNFILITPQTWKNNYNILDDKSRNRVYKEKFFNFIYCLLTKAGKLEGFSVNWMKPGLENWAKFQTMIGYMLYNFALFQTMLDYMLKM